MQTILVIWNRNNVTLRVSDSVTYTANAREVWIVLEPKYESTLTNWAFVYAACLHHSQCRWHLSLNAMPSLICKKVLFGRLFHAINCNTLNHLFHEVVALDLAHWITFRHADSSSFQRQIRRSESLLGRSLQGRTQLFW